MSTGCGETDVVEGHAVRQLYLTAGVADLYLETGEQALLDAQLRQWHDFTAHKLHVTGGAGAPVHDRLGKETAIHHFVMVEAGPTGVTDEVVALGWTAARNEGSEDVSPAWWATFKISA